MVALCLLPPPGLALAAAFDLDANRKISRSAGQAQAPRTHPQGESSRCSAEDKRTSERAAAAAHVGAHQLRVDWMSCRRGFRSGRL